MLRSREAAGLAELSWTHHSPQGEKSNLGRDSRACCVSRRQAWLNAHRRIILPRGRRAVGEDSHTCAARFFAICRACDWQAPVGVGLYCCSFSLYSSDACLPSFCLIVSGCLWLIRSLSISFCLLILLPSFFVLFVELWLISLVVVRRRRYRRLGHGGDQGGGGEGDGDKGDGGEGDGGEGDMAG